MRAEAVSNT